MRPSSSSEKRPRVETNCGGASSSSNGGVKFKGVRMRKWGKWVAEVRLPNSRDRIWLGSYNTSEKAARAYDAAVFCLRGPGATFNFPDNPPSIPDAVNLTPAQIQVAAARFAHEEGSAAAAASQTMRQSEAGEHDGGGSTTEEIGRTWPAAGWPVSGSGALDMGFFESECGASPLGCYFTRTEEEEEEEEDPSDGGAFYQQPGLWNF